MNPLKRLLPSGRRPRRVLTGLLRGIRLELDLRAGDLQLWAGLYERETFGAIRRLAENCRGALDLGAAHGELVAWLLRQPGMDRVLAVEPDQGALRRLGETLALNGLAGDPRCHLHRGFAGRGEPPQWRSLDDLAASLPEPIFVKIDIDGPESEVLSTGRDMLRRRECRVLIETHSPAAEAGCVDQLTAAGYRVTIIPNAWWRRIIPEHRPIPHNRWLAARRP
ncbi:MAG TPA: FkbM family methyltransferase [Lacunisphaera sp.]|nr:FkbM family methyltransferase [Lacunisphaera sp.]